MKFRLAFPYWFYLLIMILVFYSIYLLGKTSIQSLKFLPSNTDSIKNQDQEMWTEKFQSEIESRDLKTYYCEFKNDLDSFEYTPRYDFYDYEYGGSGDNHYFKYGDYYPNLVITYLSRAYSGLFYQVKGPMPQIQRQDFHPYDLKVKLSKAEFEDSEFDHLYYLPLTVGHHEQPMNFLLDLNFHQTFVPTNNQSCTPLVQNFSRQEGNPFFKNCSPTQVEIGTEEEQLYSKNNDLVVFEKLIKTTANQTGRNQDWNQTQYRSEEENYQVIELRESNASIDISRDKFGISYGDRIFSVFLTYFDTQQIKYTPYHYNNSLQYLVQDESRNPILLIEEQEELANSSEDSSCANCRDRETFFGVLGLKPDVSTCFSKANYIERLSNYSTIYYRMFGLNYLEGDFYLTLGGYDAHLAQQKRIAWYKMDENEQVWKVDMFTLSLSYPDRQVGVEQWANEAFFDFNERFLLLPPLNFSAVAKAYAASGCEVSRDNLIQCNCTTNKDEIFADLIFTFDEYHNIDTLLEADDFYLNKVYLLSQDYVSYSDGVCTVLMKPSDKFNKWVFGQPFFKSFSIIFDGDYKRIGFVGKIEFPPRFSLALTIFLYILGTVGIILLWVAGWFISYSIAFPLIRDSEEYSQLTAIHKQAEEIELQTKHKSFKNRQVAPQDFKELNPEKKGG